MNGSALPGEPGSIIIAGHRDTHFGFLHEIRPGAMLQLTGMHGHRLNFKITGQEIMNARLHGISPLRAGSELILVTCQPTKGMPFRGPYRLVVTAKPIEGFGSRELDLEGDIELPVHARSLSWVKKWQ